MAEPKAKKPFTAEIARARSSSFAPGEPPAEPGAAARHAELLAAIRELKVWLARFAPPGAVRSASAAEESRIDPAALGRELAELRTAIENTKREIAALRHPKAKTDPLVTAADELDAVVRATESATHSILQAAEALEEMAERVKQSAPDSYLSRTAEEMKEAIVRIYEACNFQDITGQRITKVVNTMKFIEERVLRMIEIWGTDAFQGIEPPELSPAEGERALLNGPQLDDTGVSQAEIDKLFD